MTLQIRRVVTGHDASGRAVVQIDEVPKNLVSSRRGATACVAWTTEGFPVDNTGKEDAGLRKTGTTLDNGTVFRILELAPGVSPRNHRTDSIDYAVVMSGEVDMELDDATCDLWRQRDNIGADGGVARPRCSHVDVPHGAAEQPGECDRRQRDQKWTDLYATPGDGTGFRRERRHAFVVGRFATL